VKEMSFKSGVKDRGSDRRRDNEGDANIDVRVKRLRNFCINKNKMVINREVLHRKKGYSLKNLSAECPNKAFELIPTVFIVLETCVFSVSSKR